MSHDLSGLNQQSVLSAFCYLTFCECIAWLTMRGKGKLLEAFLGKLASKVLKWALNSVISILEEFSHVSRVLACPSHGANMYELAINFSFPVPAFRPTRSQFWTSHGWHVLLTQLSLAPSPVTSQYEITACHVCTRALENQCTPGL